MWGIPGQTINSLWGNTLLPGGLLVAFSSHLSPTLLEKLRFLRTWDLFLKLLTFTLGKGKFSQHAIFRTPICRTTERKACYFIFLAERMNNGQVTVRCNRLVYEETKIFPSRDSRVSLWVLPNERENANKFTPSLKWLNIIVMLSLFNVDRTKKENQ